MKVTLRRNKYIQRRLEDSHKYWKEDIPSLTLEQIKWRYENQVTPRLGLITKDFLGSYFIIPVFQKEDGDYAIICKNKRNGENAYVYDINIEEFAKVFPVRNFPEEIYTDIEKTVEVGKRMLSAGFVEISEDKEVKIYERGGL